MTLVQKKWLAAAVAFLAAWQATNFELDYRAVLGALVAAGAGYVTPKSKA